MNEVPCLRLTLSSAGWLVGWLVDWLFHDFSYEDGESKLLQTVASTNQYTPRFKSKEHHQNCYCRENL
jgi:hypothetical protein